ncbi:hypothetical protein NFI96_026941 [Prochilodus magdalenae]|nr:hypothetical protein NFI96_026941 [Prochilodus magdalenae]
MDSCVVLILLSSTITLSTAVSVRLVDGGSRCAGRVEVYRNGQWGTVCGYLWDMADAAVVCRELGCGEAQDRVRLVGGETRCAGRVEVFRNRTWEGVCMYQWDMADAAVVCRELGCMNALSIASLGSGSGPGSYYATCNGSESTLLNCLSDDYCGRADAGVICSVSVRLVDGGSRCAGRVEVYRTGQWGTVCGYFWDMADAAVVCRELGCGEAQGIPKFAPGSGPILMGLVECDGSESALNNCRFNSIYVNICKSHDEDAGVICSGDKPRLTDGHLECSGRLEVPKGNKWYTVCDAHFDQQDAEVVCRELGCGLTVEMLGGAAFGSGEGQVWSEQLQCRGNESQIYSCKKTSIRNNTCTHESDVGITCTALCSGHTGALLVNGSDSCSGRVELQYLSEWGTVCDVSWDMRAASVLCGQLKCGSAVTVVGSDWFGEGSGQIWADVFDCQGNETHLSKCPISSWNRGVCSHQQDAGVICNGSSLVLHEGRVRLSGGLECEGEVEVYFMEDWRRVLLDSWSESVASVVCRQLGCGSVFNFSSSSLSSSEHSYMCVTSFSCSGSEAHLGNCSSAQAVNCSSREQLSITCSGKFNSGHSSIRLVGSGGDCAGRLEVFHSGSWGTVSSDLWDIEDALVVCRQLQCGVALSAPVPAQFGPGTGPIWLNAVECEGDETSLWKCRFQLCGEDECEHMEDVGVVCSEYKEIRLTGGCEGNLEVFYNGTWGNVCDNGIDDNTATLICQELNCGRSGSENRAKARVESAPNWLDDLKCRNHDSTLWQCPSSSFQKNKCADVASISCSDHLPLRLKGGRGRCSGRLEVYHNAEWGSVCNDLWDIRDARVVCRQLGCGLALSADGSSVFGAGNGTIWLNRVRCRGNEIHLWDCPYSLKNHTDCSHWQPAKVICADHLPLRLSGGRGSCSGRLEVFNNAEWGSVCDDLWDIRDAQVVCRQLGCGPALSADRTIFSGAGSGPVWLNRVRCRGNELHLWDCPHSLKKHTDCSHRQHAGVTCAGQRSLVLCFWFRNSLNNYMTVPSTTTPITTTTTFTTITVGEPLPATLPPIYPVSLLVLGVVLLLTLVLLVVLLYQNRRLRRGREIQRSSTIHFLYIL